MFVIQLRVTGISNSNSKLSLYCMYILMTQTLIAAPIWKYEYTARASFTRRSRRGFLGLRCMMSLSAFSYARETEGNYTRERNKHTRYQSKAHMRVKNILISLNHLLLRAKLCVSGASKYRITAIITS